MIDFFRCFFRRDLVVVPFHSTEGRTYGLSHWNTTKFVPYERGMTLRDLQLEHVGCTGGWVISKKTLDIINNWSFRSDDGLPIQVINAILKSQVDANCDFMI